MNETLTAYYSLDIKYPILIGDFEEIVDFAKSTNHDGIIKVYKVISEGSEYKSIRFNFYCSCKDGICRIYDRHKNLVFEEG